MKLGILLCDHVQTALQAEFDDYLDMLSQAIAQCDSAIEVQFFSIVDGNFPD